MGSLWPFSALSAAKLHELRFLISLPLHNEAVVAPREVLWMQKVSEQRCIWWGCQGPSHQPATQRVALFNAPLLVCLNTSSLPVAQWQPRTKNTTFLSSFYVFFPFCSPPLLFHLFYSNWDWSRHKQPISETSSATVSPCRSQGIPAKFAAFSASPSFWVRKKGCKLTSWGVLLCWLPETDALQEFWKQIRLTLFSGPWLLFSPMCERYEQETLQFTCIFILIVQDYLVFTHITCIHHLSCANVLRRDMLCKIHQNDFCGSDLFKIHLASSLSTTCHFIWRDLKRVPSHISRHAYCLNIDMVEIFNASFLWSSWLKKR